MKYRFSGWPYKFIAFVLAALCIGAGFFSSFLVLWSEYQNYYDPDVDTYWESHAVWSATNRYAGQLQGHFFDPAYENLSRAFEDTRFRYLLLKAEDNSLVASYLDGADLPRVKTLLKKTFSDDLSKELDRALAHEYYPMTLGETGSLFEGVYYTTYVFDAEHWSEEPELYRLVCLIDPSLDAEDDYALGQQTFAQLYPLRFSAIAMLAVSVLVFLALTTFLCVQAGRRPNEEEIRFSWLDKWPLDLLLVLAAAAGIAIAGIVCFLYDGFYTWSGSFIAGLTSLQVIVLATAPATLCGMVCLASLCSLFVRFKAGKWWRNSIVWKLGVWVWELAVRLLRWAWSWAKKPLCWLGRCLKRFFGVFPQAAKALPLAPRLIGCLLGLLAVDFFLCLFTWGFRSGFFLCLFVLYNLALLAGFIYACGQLKLLWNAAEHLSRGELDFQLDTSKMYWDFKKHGDDLNAIAQGLNKAVDQRMKSERLKTELITNVSHDIKTPLTSIVNYVDLLQKPHTEAEGVQYLEVLDRQSRKLKRLTENLVEASKASTGNLPVELNPTSVTEILNQAAEEYRERLEAGKLSLVLDPGTDLTVLADGKLLWRILDNLLGNVIKYALAGTRVYLTAARQGDRVVIAVKNISRESLNVDADELMERFVRGDASRHAEGSGLGLNIAQSLTKLQNGQFRLTVDGDLFKAEVELPVK